MRSRLLSISLITFAISGLFVHNLPVGTASAKSENSIFWDAPVKVSQPAKPKPGRKRPASRPKPDKKGEQESPLLTLKYQVLVRGDGGSAQRVDAANKEFKVGDQLKLAVTPNQNGFLYIVHHSVDNNNKTIDQPHVIFPNPGVNDGRNEVKKDEQYLVPKHCPQFEDPTDCWWEITPPSGKDFFTVIFSRDEISDLPSKLTNEDSSNDKDAIAMNIIARVKSTSNTKDIARSDKIKINSRSTTESDGTYIQNTSRSDNEELFDTIELKHQSDTGDTPVALTRALFVKKRADAMHVSFLKGGTDIDPSQVFKANDEIEVKYSSNFNGYIYLVNITPKNQRFLISPCARLTGFNITVDKSTSQPIGFDDEKGTEVLQVIISRERIDFLENAIKGDCCLDPTKCELSASAASAAAELASNAAKQQKGGIDVNNIMAVVPENRSSGVRARGITLAQGKKGGSYVAIENPSSNQDDSKLKGRYAVFEIRLNHN
ncbi:MAG: DUF4384 domain-containing protein [Blastocatellia bacterium]